MDDEPNVLHSLRRMLKDKTPEWDLIFSDSIAQATSRLNTDGIDVAVLDICMQDGNGIDLLKEIKQNPDTGDIEVIMLTGLSDDGYKQKALNLGAADLLSKPVQPEELTARLKNALQLRSHILELREKNTILQDQLIHSQKMELIGFLAAGAVHDLNGLLSVISGFSTLLIETGQITDKNHEDLIMVADAARRASEITKQILAFTKNNKMIVENVDLNAVTNECVELLKHSVPKRIQIHWQSAASSYTVKGVAVQLYQLILNLLFNARNAIEVKGSISVSLSYKNKIPDSVMNKWQVSPGPCYCISVTDTGKGIPSENLQHIFEPLFSTGKQHGGTGLGLSVVRTIVQKYKGAISIQSELGKGATFSIYLPAR